MDVNGRSLMIAYNESCFTRHADFVRCTLSIVSIRLSNDVGQLVKQAACTENCRQVFRDWEPLHKASIGAYIPIIHVRSYIVDVDRFVHKENVPILFTACKLCAPWEIEVRRIFAVSHTPVPFYVKKIDRPYTWFERLKSMMKICQQILPTRGAILELILLITWI